jgi:NAD(P)-dependent dehydrogenase (short-subunit alcohol dehydrogenase family)
VEEPEGLAVLLLRASGSDLRLRSLAGEGFIVLPINGVYAIAKHGLEALSDALRLELAPSGRFVSVVVPGGVSTPILERAVARYGSLLEEGGPMVSYRAQIRGRRRLAERGLAGRGPESTAARVVAAVKARRPRAHYFVGWDAWAPAILARLPTRLRDLLLRHALS